MPPEDYRRLAASLETVPPEFKRTIYKPGERTRHVCFPADGFFSMLAVLANGDMVEVATVGRESVIGAPAAVADTSKPSFTMVQAEMQTCYRLPVAAFRREMDRRGAFASLITKYIHAPVGVIMQGTACNAVHTVEQRLARWLLMAHDQVGKDSFPLTQEFLAMMLGAARPTVTIVAGTLQRAGLINYKRGQLTVEDRDGLEKASCERYAATTNLITQVTLAAAS